jgi:hypothetical protein
MGLSKPRSLFNFSTFSGVANDPRMAVAGSPGIKAIIMKTIMEIPISTGIADTSRLRI